MRNRSPPLSVKVSVKVLEELARVVEESGINLLEMARKLAIMLLIASHLGSIPAPATIPLQIPDGFETGTVGFSRRRG